jgi:SAM-dependent methyltransferase
MTEWFEEWFGEEYLHLYPHRDEADAGRLLDLIRRSVPWQPRWRVLDVACGAGRHMRAITEAGGLPFGLDLSASLLRRARDVTDRPLIRADMRRLPIRPGSVDLALNLFTSFGYFSTDEEHQDALAGMVATLQPGGWFVLDFLNADHVRANLVPHEASEIEGATVEITRRLSEDGRFVRKSITTSEGREFMERVRLFSAGDLRRMLGSCGLLIGPCYGDYSGNSLDGSSPRTILIGQRP